MASTFPISFCAKSSSPTFTSLSRLGLRRSVFIQVCPWWKSYPSGTRNQVGSPASNPWVFSLPGADVRMYRCRARNPKKNTAAIRYSIPFVE